MWGALQWIVRQLFTLTVILTVCFIGFIVYLKGQALPEQAINYTTKIYSNDYQIIDRLTAGENRVYVSLDEISDYLKNATIAIEDHRFYSHLGFDVKGIIRALSVNLQHRSRIQGGSTISQQLAKNLYLSHSRTWERKFHESILTAQIELHYSKDYILEKYLNQIYYGHGNYGIEAASRSYFGKPASDLTLAEASLLAGIPKGPSLFSPFLHLENAMNRQQVILQRMYENGYIAKSELTDALQADIVFHEASAQNASSLYFRDYVLSELVKLGFNEADIRTQGLEIITTLDLEMQKTAASLIDSHLHKYDDIQSALITINPENGNILAMIGGRDYRESPFNRTQARRQSGSTFKPFVYLAALNSGLTPISKLKSEPARFTYDRGRQEYMPRNFNDFYFNEDITFLKAMAVSDNVVAVKTNLMVRPELVKETAQTLGINSYMQAEPSLALGSFPVTPLEMTVAYATIANQGIRIEPRSILEVRDQRGRLLYHSEPEKQIVHAPETLYVVTDMMRSVFEPGGTGFRTSDLLPFDVAGKTGTTDTDAWMIGFTPDNVTAVWIGYDRDRFISRQESYLATPLWATYMSQVAGTTLNAMAHDDSEPKGTVQYHRQFSVPSGVSPVSICLDTGERALAECKNTRTVFFVRGTEPY